MPDGKVVKSEREGKVIRDKNGTPKRSQTGVKMKLKNSGGGNVKSYTNRRVTINDDGSYTRRKEVKSITSGDASRDANGTGQRN